MIRHLLIVLSLATVFFLLPGCASRSQVGMLVDMPASEAAEKMNRLKEAGVAWPSTDSTSLPSNRKFVFPGPLENQKIRLVDTEVELIPRGRKTLLRASSVGFAQSSFVRGDLAEQNTVLRDCIAYLERGVTPPKRHSFPGQTDAEIREGLRLWMERPTKQSTDIHDTVVHPALQSPQVAH